jgi:Flp pilus assembly protein protease CpaA
MVQLLPLLGAILSTFGALVSHRWSEARPLPWQILLCAALGAAAGAIPWLVPALPPSMGVAITALYSLLITIALVELQVRIIPNHLVVIGLAIAVISRLHGPELVDGFLGLALAFGVLLTLSLARDRFLGLGSVKLGGAIGAVLGWQLALVWLAAGLGILAVLAVYGLVVRRRGGGLVASSPLWVIALTVTILVGPQLVRAVF